MTIELDSGNNAFRIELTPLVDLLSMSKNELYEELITGYVSSAWWDMSEADRRELALRIINWWSIPLSIYEIKTWPNWEIRKPYCLGNASIRFSIIGDCSLCFPSSIVVGDDTPDYWKLGGTWKAFGEDDCFNLPCKLCVVNATDFSHAICALQIGEDQLDFDSWIFFQYNEADIKPGDSQMPAPGSTEILNVNTVYLGGWSDTELIAKWTY